MAKSTTIESSPLFEESLLDFRLIYEQYAQYVRKTLFWMVPAASIDDLCQDVFVKVWKNRHSFRSDSSLKTWIYRITMNTAYDHLRKIKAPVDSFDEIIHSEESSLDESLKAGDIFIRKSIYEGIQTLSSKHKQVFVLFYKQEQSIEDIALILKVSEGTVKSRLHHARQQFTHYLKQKGVTYESE